MPDDGRATRLNDGDGLEIAHEEDFGIQRNDGGDLLPVMQRIPGTEKAIKVKPLTPGQRAEYSDVLDTGDADAERVAELWNTHIVDGVGSDVDPADLEGEDGIPYGLSAAINQALKNSSGVELFLAVREQQDEELDANMRLLERVGDDNLEQLTALANGADAASQK